MSAIKFACPICGQHITCDAGSSGAPMDCPTCFRKLIVPQASTTSQFILTATEAPTPTTARSSQGPVPGAARSKRSPILAIAVGMVFLAAAATAAIYLATNKERHAHDQTKSPAHHLTLPPPAPGATNWTLNLAAAQIPDAPVSGAVNGYGFTLERATIQGGRLDLRQGPKWPPEVGVSIHLFANRAEDLAGRTVMLEATRTNAPRVLLRWKDAEAQAQTREFRQGYAARVEFGPVTNNRLAGKIFLATPDDAKSYVAGTFSAEIRKPAPKK